VRLHLVGAVAMSFNSAWGMVRIGFPAFIGELSFSGSRLLITPLVATFGTDIVAAYGVGTQLFGFGIMVLVGLGLGLSSLIGHNLGADKIDRARSTADQSILVGIGIMTVMGLISYFLAEQYMGIFFESESTIRYGAEMLRIWALAFPFFGAMIMIEMVHSGVGMNMPNMIVIAIHGWGLQVIPALIVTHYLGMDQIAIWWIFGISGVISSIGFYLYYRRGKWLTARV
jgi:Na+-driven multidrug efflux pump